MSLFDKVVSGLSESLGEVALALNSRVNVPSRPRLFLLSAFLATTLASNYVSAALVTLPVAALSLKDRSGRKVMLYVTGFSLVVSLPLLLNNVSSVASFVLRVFSSSGLFVYLVSVVGWEGLVRALGEAGAPKELVLALRLLPYQLYVALEDLNTLVLARRARTFRESLKDVWWTLSTAVGSLLLKGTRRAETVAMALKARGFESPSVTKSSFPTLISVIVCGVSVIAVLVRRVVLV